MKNIFSLIFLILISCVLFSCRSKDLADESAPRIILKQAMVAGTSKQVMDTEIPEAAIQKFKTSFPNISDVSWYEYKPEPMDDLDISSMYYYAEFEKEAVVQLVWYNDKGSWVKTSTSLSFEEGLPRPVMRSVQDLYPGYVIEHIEKEIDERGESFEISLQKDDLRAKLKLLPDGTQYMRKENG